MQGDFRRFAPEFGVFRLALRSGWACGTSICWPACARRAGRNGWGAAAGGRERCYQGSPAASRRAWPRSAGTALRGAARPCAGRCGNWPAALACPDRNGSLPRCVGEQPPPPGGVHCTLLTPPLLAFELSRPRPGSSLRSVPGSPSGAPRGRSRPPRSCRRGRSGSTAKTPGSR